MSTTTRRHFLASSAAAAAGTSLGLKSRSARGAARRPGPSDTIRMGFIGVGNRGSQLLELFMANPDVQVVALCDVYEPYTGRDAALVDPGIKGRLGGRVPSMGETFDTPVDRHSDFRQLIERDDIDAVCIATPDHWHAIQGIQAMRAGKDIYIEKPLTMTIQEGRALVDAGSETGRVAQVGLNRRGSKAYQVLAERIAGGLIGDVSVARAYRISNMYPNGIGREQPTDPPPGLDWDMWLGPRAKRPYQPNITPYMFRWWSDYSSQMGNWGVHYLDVIRWMIGESAPVAVSAHGSHRVVPDDRTIPDTMEAVFEFASGAVAVFGVYEACGGAGIQGGEVELRGTAGTCFTRQDGFRLEPARSGQFQDWDALMEPSDVDIAEGEDSKANLIRDFLDCVKSRQTPLCPLEEGHRSTTFAHLANIALETGERLVWDAESERFTNSEKANQHLHYDYREPWTLL